MEWCSRSLYGCIYMYAYWVYAGDVHESHSFSSLCEGLPSLNLAWHIKAATYAQMNEQCADIIRTATALAHTQCSAHAASICTSAAVALLTGWCPWVILYHCCMSTVKEGRDLEDRWNEDENVYIAEIRVSIKSYDTSTFQCIVHTETIKGQFGAHIYIFMYTCWRTWYTCCPSSASSTDPKSTSSSNFSTTLPSQGLESQGAADIRT